MRTLADKPPAAQKKCAGVASIATPALVRELSSTFL